MHFLLYFFLFFIGTGVAGEQLPSETMLPNGLRVVTYEMHHAPLIFLSVIYDASPRNEYPGITGISHMLEHMMFMGTGKHPGDQFIRELRERGATLNGFTTNDFAAYFDYFPSGFLNDVLMLEADRMTDLQLDSLTFIKERSVVRNERLRKVDNSPRALIDEDFKNLFYRTHPYRNPGIGYLADIDNFTLSKVRSYYRKYYRPDNAVLLLVGDFNTAGVLDQVKKIFNFMPIGPAPEKPAIFELPPAGKREVIYRSDIFTKPSIGFHFHLPDINDPDAPALDALMAVLGRPSSSLGRLHKVLVEQKKLAEYTGTAGYSFRDAGFMSVRVTANDTASFDEIEAAVTDIFADLKENLISEDELQPYKIKERYLQATQASSIEGFGQKMIYYIMQGGWKYRLQELPEIKKALTPEDIRSVARKYLDMNQCLVEYRIPAKDNAGSVSDADDSGEASPFYFVTPEPDTREAVAPAATGFHISQQVKFSQLPNGIKVYQMQNPAVGVWGLQGLWRTGDILENDTIPQIGAMLSFMMNRGTKKHSRLDLEKRTQYYQIREGFSGGNIDFTMYGEGLVEYADTLLSTLQERLYYPAFGREDMEKYLQMAENRKMSEKNNPKQFANEKILELLFPGHPYSREEISDPARLSTVTAEKLHTMWERYFRPDNLTLLVYGPLDSLQNIKLIDQYFGGPWPMKEPLSDFNPVLTARQISRAQEVKIENPDLAVAEIRIAFPGPLLSSPDALAFEQVSNMLARGSVTSYLGKILRNKLGLTYYIGLNSDGGPRPHGGSLIIQTQVAKENVPEFMKTIRGLLKEFPAQITDEEWKADQKRLNLGYIKKFDDFENVVARVFSKLQEGEPVSRLDDYTTRLNNIRSTDLQRVAREYIDPDKMIVLIYGAN